VSLLLVSSPLLPSELLKEALLGSWSLLELLKEALLGS